MDGNGVGAAADPLIAILELIPAPVLVLDQRPDGQFVIAHQNRYYARTAADPPVGGLPLDVAFPARIAGALVQSYRACLDHGDATFDELLRIGAEERWWRTTLSRLDPPAGMSARIIGISTDITDLRTGKEALAHEVADLRDQHREALTLAALTAHDMRGPLGNVISLTDLVLEDFHDFGNGKGEMIRACREVAETSLGAISQIMARIAEPLPAVQAHATIDLAKVCRQLAAIADPGGTLRISHPDDLVESDDLVIQLALRNLLDNATRYADSRIEIGLETADGDRIALTVADDGPGFLPGSDPVARAAARSGLGGGRGFGLNAVIRLLRSRGGDLAAIRSPLGGAAMRFTLPGRIRGDTPRRLAARRTA